LRKKDLISLIKCYARPSSEEEDVDEVAEIPAEAENHPMQLASAVGDEWVTA
jgi:hypothetical protein